MFFIAAALSILALTPIIVAQFVPAPTDLKTAKGYAGFTVRYKQVPTGICELDPSVKSYSGYVDVAPDQHIFFWFFEARTKDPSTAPLSVWINGGPGSSSMIGLFQENGPCGVDANGDVINNRYSWSTVSNMIYIDQPTQTGFSYSIPIPGYVDANTDNVIELPGTTCPEYAAGSCGTYSYPNLTLTANATAAAAPNMWATLQGFMGAFPQYSRESFNFATESYGGHYGPVFNEYIETQNAKNIPGAHKINLETVLIGNGWFSPLLQYAAYYNFTVSPGNTYGVHFNESISNQMYNNLYGPGNCVDQLNDCAARGINEVCNAADNFCANEVEELYDINLGRDEYDIRELTPDPFPYEYYVDYLNTPAVQAAIGAYQNYSEFSNAVGLAFQATGDDGREDGTVADLGKLLAQNISVMMYTGDADYICNCKSPFPSPPLAFPPRLTSPPLPGLGTEAVSVLVPAPGFSTAGYTNLSTPDAVVHGQVKQAGPFSFVRVYESGHEVPFYQPLAALTIFERAIAHDDIATGTVPVRPGGGYKSVGTQKSTYRQGGATVQHTVLPADATYNTTTNAPDPPKKARERRGRGGRALGRRRGWAG
ncbi:hypothetical protein MMC15_005025 [Xylographa vitiligo]|nr:hypothetical protein [Xylographa vitiligo]